MLELLICKKMSFENNIYSEINGFLMHNISKNIPYVQILRTISKKKKKWLDSARTTLPLYQRLQYTAVDFHTQL